MTTNGSDAKEASTATGARMAKPSWFARMVARAISREMRAFVVPGDDVARARGLDLEAAGLVVSATPRHASVLVLVGVLSSSLKRAAAIAYAQMPRPRAIFAIDEGDIPPLPEPVVRTLADQNGLTRGVEELSRWFSENSFRQEASDFDADAVRTRTEYTCSMHPEVASEEPGSCPICGMDLIRRKSVGEADERGGNLSHESMDDEEIAHDSLGHMTSHDSMEHGDMDFMSMVEVTKGLPRSRDGLPMEWVEAPFGPLLPGLPGGLTLHLTLDGDAVARAGATSVVAIRNLESSRGPVELFVEQVASLDPFSPVAYRVLALRALENATGEAPDERTLLARVGATELERVASHLGWLANLGRLLGHERLARRAGGIQISLLRITRESGAGSRAMKASELAELRTRTNGFINGVRRTPLLKRRMEGVALFPEDADTSGPVARAGGVPADARADEDAYRGLGFEAVVGEGGDALARARVRLAEIERSLDLTLAAGFVSVPEYGFDPDFSGTGEAAIETPRGTATMKVCVESGAVGELELRTPSTRHLRLVEGMADDREIAEFLVGVASLDISPWEVVL